MIIPNSAETSTDFNRIATLNMYSIHLSPHHYLQNGVTTNQRSEAFRNTASDVTTAKTWFLRMCELVQTVLDVIVDRQDLV